jgi:hypothetical protein
LLISIKPPGYSACMLDRQNEHCHKFARAVAAAAVRFAMTTLSEHDNAEIKTVDVARATMMPSCTRARYDIPHAFDIQHRSVRDARDG